MEIAGDEGLCCNAAACADHFDRETFVAMIAFLDSDKLILLFAGYGRDRETDFFFGASDAINCSCD